MQKVRDDWTEIDVRPISTKEEKRPDKGVYKRRITTTRGDQSGKSGNEDVEIEKFNSEEIKQNSDNSEASTSGVRKCHGYKHTPAQGVEIMQDKCH